MALRESKRKQKSYSELMVLPEGRYEGTIVKTTSSQTEDRLTDVYKRQVQRFAGNHKRERAVESRR